MMDAILAYSYNHSARVLHREVRITLMKVHLGLETKAKKLMLLKIRKKTQVPTRLEKL